MKALFGLLLLAMLAGPAYGQTASTLACGTFKAESVRTGSTTRWTIQRGADKASETANLRILAKPDTVNALQELTRIAVQTKTGAFSRLILDVGGSREARVAELTILVDKAIERIDGGAESAALPPRSSYERKLVHDVVGERGFVSESEGEGRDRHTVITRA